MTKEVLHPRAEVDAVLAEFLPKISSPNLKRYFVGGSYVRGRQASHDIDIAVDVVDLPSFFELVASVGTYGGKKAPRDCKKLTVEFAAVQIDFWVAKPGGWGALCMFVAGSGACNVQQRARAKAQGFALSQDGLFGADGNLIPAETELEIYRILGWQWLNYAARDIEFR